LKGRRKGAPTIPTKQSTERGYSAGGEKKKKKIHKKLATRPGDGYKVETQKNVDRKGENWCWAFQQRHAGVVAAWGPKVRQGVVWAGKRKLRVRSSKGGSRMLGEKKKMGGTVQKARGQYRALFTKKESWKEENRCRTTSKSITKEKRGGGEEMGRRVVEPASKQSR